MSNVRVLVVNQERLTSFHSFITILLIVVNVAAALWRTSLHCIQLLPGCTPVGRMEHVQVKLRLFGIVLTKTEECTVGDGRAANCARRIRAEECDPLRTLGKPGGGTGRAPGLRLFVLWRDRRGRGPAHLCGARRPRAGDRRRAAGGGRRRRARALLFRRGWTSSPPSSAASTPAWSRCRLSAAAARAGLPRLRAIARRRAARGWR